MRLVARIRVVSYLVGVCVALSGCATLGLTTTAKTVITGKVWGEDPQPHLGANDTSIAIAATVTCNGVSTESAKDGFYRLLIAPARKIDCTAQSPQHSAQTAQLLNRSDSVIVLNFGPGNSTCLINPYSAALDCAALRYVTGSISGRVMFASTGQPAPGIAIKCTSATAATTSDLSDPTYQGTSTRADGTYEIGELSPASYTCLAFSGDTQFQQTTLAPGAHSTLDFHVCKAQCPPIHYHLGRIMHTMKAYLIYWLPSGYVYEPRGDDHRFQTLVAQYFSDVGNTSFAGLLTHYWDFTGPATADLQLGGTWVDTSPYQHCIANTGCKHAAATRADPLQADDIQSEITRAMAANHWTAGLDAAFFVMLVDKVEQCDGASFCSYDRGVNGFCAYHSSFGVGGQPVVIYASLEDAVRSDCAATVRIHLQATRSRMVSSMLLRTSSSSP